MLSFHKFRIGYKLVPLLLQHLDEFIQSGHHLSATVVPYDKGHFKLRVILQVVELPGVEVSHKIAVIL
jgi:hypothetical protein